VGRTNGANVDAPLVACLAVLDGFGAIQPDRHASFIGSTEAYSTMRNIYPCGDIKGGGSQEGFYFIFGKWGR
jgi:hypothetical protein